MIDHRPIVKLQALIGTLSALNPSERYWLYKMVENVVLYDRVIDKVSPAMDINDVEEDLNKLLEEWYEIQMCMKKSFDNDTIASLNGRVIPVYRVFRRRNVTDEQTKS